jgi:hypothetical protein
MSASKSCIFFFLACLSSACTEDETTSPSSPDFVPDLSQICTPPDPMQGVDPIDHLIITEISEDENNGFSLWFELYNPTDADIDVTGYKLTTVGVDTVNMIFLPDGLEHTLDAVTIPAKSYFVFFRPNLQSVDNNISNEQLDFLPVITNKVISFSYTNQGLAGVALRDSSGNAIDFARFGGTTNLYLEAKSGEWIGENANMAADNTKTISMIRKVPYQDTNTKADWGVSNVLTPGGDNFFAEGADLDHDGIPDAAEDGVNAAGETDSCEYFNGQLLYRMGARPNVRNIFVEIDMQAGLPHSIEQEMFVHSRERLFTHQQGINYKLTFDIGDMYSSTFDPDLHNLSDGTEIHGGGNILLQTDTISALDQGVANNFSVENARYEHQDLRRMYLFHYAVIGHLLIEGRSTVGSAVLKGSSIAMGFNTFFDGQSLEYQNNLMGNTLIHELGHNLNLQHGGDTEINKKPNYVSVMNYLYGTYFPLQNDADPLPWLFDQKNCSLFQPFYLSIKDIVEIAGIMGSEESFRYNFSHGQNHPINPLSAEESKGVHWSVGTQIPIDFNCNDKIDIANIYSVFGSSNTLEDYNDWAMIKDMVNMAVYTNNPNKPIPNTGGSPVSLPEDSIKAAIDDKPSIEAPICPAPPRPPL